MWESAAGLHNSLARTVPHSARNALVAEPSVIPVICDRPALQLGPRPRSQPVAQRCLRESHQAVKSCGIPRSPQDDSRQVRLRCVEPKGVAYRQSKNLVDVIGEATTPRARFGHELVAEEVHGAWARAARGWLPLLFDGKRRFLELEIQPQEMSKTSVEAMTMAEELATLKAKFAEKSQHISFLEDKLQAVTRDQEKMQAYCFNQPLTKSKIIESESESNGNICAADQLTTQNQLGSVLPRPPPEHVSELVKQQVVVQGRDYYSWPRVRLPVCTGFIERFGLEWIPTLRQRLAGFVQQGATASIIEVVAVRTREDEMNRFEEASTRRLVMCQPNHSVTTTADHAATVPTIGNHQSMKWYGELACIQEPFWIVELAVSSCTNATSLIQGLHRELNGRTLSVASTRVFKNVGPVDGFHGLSRPSAYLHAKNPALHLNDIVPRQLTRVFEWPPEPVHGEDKKERHMLRSNPRI